MKKINIIYLMILITTVILILLPQSSAGILEWINKTLTGKVTSSVDVNITVGAGGGNAPNITLVFNATQIGGTLNEGPINTSFIINFSNCFIIYNLESISSRSM